MKSNFSRWLCAVMLLLMLFGNTGCALLHELKPYRLQRLNRGPGMDSTSEAYYSIDDPIPPRSNGLAEN